jgi:hypothetical protein
MVDHMKTDTGYLNFEAYLKTVYCEENIHFWKEVEKLKQLEHGESDHIAHQIHHIVKVFLQHDADEDVENIDFGDQDFVAETVNVNVPNKLKVLQFYKDNNYSQDMFHELQEDVIVQLFPYWKVDYDCGRKTFLEEVHIAREKEDKKSSGFTIRCAIF